MRWCCEFLWMRWDRLRAVGNLRVLKVSYVVWAVIPFISQQGWLVTAMGLSTWQLAEVYFASIFLAAANLVYDLACPPIVKRFASPNDLYSKMLEMRELSVRLYPEDHFEGSLSHCKNAYNEKRKSAPIPRCACAVLFVAAAGLFGVILLHRTIIVVMALSTQSGT